MRYSWQKSWDNHEAIMRYYENIHEKIMGKLWGKWWDGHEVYHEGEAVISRRVHEFLKVLSWFLREWDKWWGNHEAIMRQSWENHEEIMSKSWRKSWGKSWDSHEKYHETAIEKEKKREKRTKVEKQKRVRIRSVRMRIMGGAPWETICDLRLLLAVRINGRYSIPPFRTSLNISEPKPPIK